MLKHFSLQQNIQNPPNETIPIPLWILLYYFIQTSSLFCGKGAVWCRHCMCMTIFATENGTWKGTLVPRQAARRAGDKLSDWFQVQCEMKWETISERWANILRNPCKIDPKWYQILGKSTFGAVLEHFGRPLGAKMAQERHQEQTLMKNNQF